MHNKMLTSGGRPPEELEAAHRRRAQRAQHHRDRRRQQRHFQRHRQRFPDVRPGRKGHTEPIEGETGRRERVSRLFCRKRIECNDQNREVHKDQRSNRGDLQTKRRFGL